MNRYICGICRKKKNVKEFVSTREGLRKHLKDEHFIRSDLANVANVKGKKQTQSFWIVEEIE